MPELTSLWLQYWPKSIPGVIFLYAFIVLLLTTIRLIIGIVRAKLRLSRVQTHDELLAAFAQSRLERLVPRILDVARPEWPISGNRIVIQSAFSPGRARREIAHLYRRRLTRVHFFAALAVLLAIAALSWIQDYAHIAGSGMILPPLALTLAAALVLALFGGLGWRVIDGAAKSLLDKISELPLERAEITWLRALATMLERIASKPLPGSQHNSIAVVEQTLERLNEITESNLRSLDDPILRLSAAAEALTTAVEVLSENPAHAVQAASLEKVAALSAAIDLLTIKMDRPTAALQGTPVPPAAKLADTNSHKSATLNGDGNIKQQVRDLLKEFE